MVSFISRRRQMPHESRCLLSFCGACHQISSSCIPQNPSKNMGARWNQKNAYIPRALWLALALPHLVDRGQRRRRRRRREEKAVHHYVDCFTRRRTHNPRCASAIPLLMQIIIMLGTHKTRTKTHTAPQTECSWAAIVVPILQVCFATGEKFGVMGGGGGTSFAISCTLTNTRHPKSHHSLRFTPTKPLFKPPTPVRRPSYSLFDKAREVLAGHSFLFFFCFF